MKRKMSVNGSFYPGRGVEIERYFEHFNALYDEEHTLPTLKSRAVIVPHAGYIYSGYTANIAYRVLARSGVKKFAIIGPSHRVGFGGISLCGFSAYETPFGGIMQASSLFDKLHNEFSFVSLYEAHAEHSTEVQFPFVKYYIEDAQIVEMVYSDADAKYLSKVIDFLLSFQDTGVIISTDLSHFYNLSNATRLDNICLDAIKEVQPDILDKGCEACGKIGIKALLLSAKKRGMQSRILDYRTSADASGDTQQVVGYVSACFNE